MRSSSKSSVANNENRWRMMPIFQRGGTFHAEERRVSRSSTVGWPTFGWLICEPDSSRILGRGSPFPRAPAGARGPSDGLSALERAS